MTSLKGYIPALARHLGTTPAALYERQRALVRAGLLDQSEGRGPGSGVRATAPSVAMLLLAVLAADSLTETDGRIGAIAAAQPQSPQRRCRCTRAKSFLDALAAILVTSGLAAGVIEIEVSRTADRGRIKFYDADGTDKVSEFAGARVSEPDLSVSAKLSHNLLKRVADDVQAIEHEKFNSSGNTQP
jgi:hypothetical protein